MKKEIETFSQWNLSIGDYRAKFRALWHELELYPSLEPYCAKKQVKLLEYLHVFELLDGVNPAYETVFAQVTSQDPLPPMILHFCKGRELKKNKDD